MKYFYYDFRSKENEKLLKKQLSGLEKLFPYWVQEFILVEAKSDEDSLASVNFSPEYRRATIYIHPPFYTIDAERQRQALIHEIAHTITAEYCYWVHYNILEFIKTKFPDAYEVLDKEHVVKFESITQDLSYIFQGVLDES